MPAMLTLTELRLAISGQVLIDRLSLQVEPGQVASLMGPSGCGKSSLLAAIAGTLPGAFEASGQIQIGTLDLAALPASRRKVGLLMQDALLLPHLTVAQNLLFALPKAVKGRSARRDLVDQALERAGLKGLGDRDPSTLSGGQAMRVALMRSLINMPRALLLDEPFARLDAPLRARMRKTVFQAVQALQIPALLVTHDPADAAAASETGGMVVQL